MPELINEVLPLKAVIYTDGGCHQSIGTGGWGFHGYLYREVEPKRGHGVTGFIPTAKGYKSKTDLAKLPEITIERYVDANGSITFDATNNIAEIMALIKAYEYVIRKDIEDVHFVLDSKYVLDGIEKWLQNWIKNDWKKTDGTELSNINYWKQLYELIQRTESAGIKISYSWIKGHSGHPGNNAADNSATKGLIVAQKKINQNQVDESEPMGYWNKKVEYNRMFGASRLIFFSHLGQTEKNRHGYYPYYLYDPPAQWETVLFGTRDPDASFSIIYLNNFEPVVEQVYKYQNILDTQRLNSVCCMRLDHVFKPKLYTEIMENGDMYLYTNKRRCDILTIDNTSLTEEIRPPRLAYRGIEDFEKLEKIFKEYIDNPLSDKITITDITPNIYEGKSSGKKNEIKIRKEIDMVTKHIDLDIFHNLNGEPEPFKTRLIFGTDLPKRNVLVAVSDNNPELKVITWKEADTVFHFATVLKTDEGIGIWGNVYTNFRFI